MHDCSGIHDCSWRVRLNEYRNVFVIGWTVTCVFVPTTLKLPTLDPSQWTLVPHQIWTRPITLHSHPLNIPRIFWCVWCIFRHVFFIVCVSVVRFCQNNFSSTNSPDMFTLWALTGTSLRMCSFWDGSRNQRVGNGNKSSCCFNDFLCPTLYSSFCHLPKRHMTCHHLSSLSASLLPLFIMNR